MKMALTIALLMLAAGCATPSGNGATPRSAETIRYETAPCFGACPVYAVTLSPDGTARFEGKRFTVATGEHAFTVTPDQLADFRRRLAPYRPAGGERRIAPGEADCGPAMTDQPSVSVSWQGGGAPPVSLSLYYGCAAPALKAMKAALRAAPDALPIAMMIGRR